MPANFYGPFDNFNLKTSQKILPMIRKPHEVKIYNNSPVELLDSGSPIHEFLNVDDLAKAILFIINDRMNSHLQKVGYVSDIRFKSLAELFQSIICHNGEINRDRKRPDIIQKNLWIVA
jgi:GDP-L-fucose synthase